MEATVAIEQPARTSLNSADAAEAFASAVRTFTQIADEQKTRVVYVQLEPNSVSSELIYSQAASQAEGWPGQAIFRAAAALDGFSAYDVPDWDGEGAVAISAAARGTARRVLEILPTTTPMPDIAPGGDGSICMEWYIHGRKLWVDVSTNATVAVYYNLGAGLTGGDSFLANSGKLAELIKQVLSALYVRQSAV